MAKVLCVTAGFGMLLREGLEEKRHKVWLAESFAVGYLVIQANPDLEIVIWDPVILNSITGLEKITDLDWVRRVKQELAGGVTHVGFSYDGHSERVIKVAGCDHVFPLAQVVEQVCSLLTHARPVSS